MKNYGIIQKHYLIGDLKYKATSVIDKCVPVDNEDFRKDLVKLKPEAIKLFNKLIAEDKDTIYIGLWNQILCFMENEEIEDISKYVSHEGKEYIDYILEKEREWVVTKPNLNDDIILERLILSIPSLDDDYLLLEEMKRTKDYKIFSSITEAQIHDLSIYEKPLSFSIYLKEEKKMVGTVQLVQDVYAMNSYYLEYYIFEEYRQKGYATEAIRGLIDVGFKKQLKMKRNTPYRYLSLIENRPIRFIRCTIRPDNAISIKTAIKCGFEYDGTFKDYFYDYNNDRPLDISFFTIRNERFGR